MWPWKAPGQWDRPGAGSAGTQQRGAAAELGVPARHAGRPGQLLAAVVTGTHWALGMLRAQSLQA